MQSVKRLKNAVATAIGFMRWADMDTLYVTLIIKWSDMAWNNSLNTHQDSFSMFDGQVLVLECQDGATGCIQVCNMVTSRIRNGGERSGILNIASISRLDYTEVCSRKTKFEPTLLLQVRWRKELPYWPRHQEEGSWWGLRQCIDQWTCHSWQHLPKAYPIQAWKSSSIHP